jgi:hypothetical protein
MRITSAEERLKQQTGVKAAIFGPFGIGKTSLLKTLDEPTLCLDLEAVQTKWKDCDFSKYKCIFIDSITIALKLCLTWCKMQPESFSEKSGKPDTRSAYGLLASEMSGWLNQFQHVPDKDVIIVGLLEQKTDDFNRTIWSPQIEGSKTTNELPGIVDEVISMISMKNEFGKLERKFVCHTLNQCGFPAKDRSGRLDEIEDAHLGKLLAKIKINEGDKQNKK